MSQNEEGPVAEQRAQGLREEVFFTRTDQSTTTTDRGQRILPFPQGPVFVTANQCRFQE